jgi:hypothetical protein
VSSLSFYFIGKDKYINPTKFFQEQCDKLPTVQSGNNVDEESRKKWHSFFREFGEL